jgi:hypothetical protein
MVGALNPGEESQLKQTIEMFELITQSQPQDYQSLEILKEAYLKLNMEKEVTQTSKRIAQAYVQLGQLSSAILEYETILQCHPDDRDAMVAMAQIETKATSLTAPQPAEMELTLKEPSAESSRKRSSESNGQPDFDDGRATMRKFFVEAKLITEGDFQACWPSQDLHTPPTKTVDPFIQNLAERQIMPLNKSLRILSDRSRLAFIPLERYEIDMDLVRSVPRQICQRWCIMPVDRMSRTLMVATANPFNKQAVLDLKESTQFRLLWYLASPNDLMRALATAMR